MHTQTQTQKQGSFMAANKSVEDLSLLRISIENAICRYDISKYDISKTSTLESAVLETVEVDIVLRNTHPSHAIIDR